MATNKVFEQGDQLSLVVSSPASPTSGQAVRYGKLVGVATTDERADGTTSVDFRGVYDLPVKGEDDMGNAAIAVGAVVYFEDANAYLSADAVNAAATAGHVLEAVGSGTTATVQVRLLG